MNDLVEIEKLAKDHKTLKDTASPADLCFYWTMRSVYDCYRLKRLSNEDARFVLPNAACTSMVMTMNARELLHFFRLRTCNRAQWEIREVADKMLAECYRVAPTIFADAGCGCCTGACPEGRMSCGKPRKAEIDVIKEGDINNEH